MPERSKQKTMYKTSHVFKKALSVVLSALMLVGMFSVGLIVPAAVANAAETGSAADPMGLLTFIVPEAIYLYPNGSSWTASTSSPFQYYVNNDANNAPVTAAESTGKIYYKYAYTFDQQNYGAETAVITYQFVDSSFRALSGGSVTLSSNTISSGGSVDITAGQSPSLGANANGCYILWTLTLTDAADGRVKRVYALTYVYKPYVAPVGVMVETFNKYANDSHANQLTWISGMHSITQQTSGTHDGNYYPRYSGDYGMSSFITAGNKAYVGGAEYTAGMNDQQGNAWTASDAGATRYNLAFINTPTSGAHFDDARNHDNRAATDWGSASSSGSTFNVSSFDYWYKTVNPALWGRQALAAVYATPYGNITIDTSRYNNLSQIPNLGVGLFVVSNEESSRANWYVADYSTGSRVLGYNGSATDDSNSDSEKNKYFNDYSYIIAGQGTSSWDAFQGDYDGEGVKYAGAWPRSLQNVPAANDENNSALYASTYDYAVKGFFGTADKGAIDSTSNMDYCFAHGTVRLTANQLNKSTLRAAVQHAISEMAALGVNGISNGNITSCYFDANSDYKWTALQVAFKNAVLGLTTLNSTANPNDLAKTLNAALEELCTKVEVDANGGSFTSLNTLEYIKIGDQIPTTNGFRFTPTYSGPSKEYYSFQGWSGNPNTHSGLSYVRVGYNGKAYATWKPIDYTMTLVPADDDNVNVGNKTAVFNIETEGTMGDIFAANGSDLENYPLPRQGYSFWYWEVVWADEGSNWTVGEVFYTADQIEGRHGNVRMKAHWAEGMVDVNVYNYEMNGNGSYLNSVNRLVPTDTYSTFGTTNQIITIDPNPRVGFTVDTQKSRLTGTPAANGSTILKVFYARNQYDVTFVNFDGSVLQAAKPVYYEAAPVYTGPTPRRAAENGIRYTFSGWNDGVRTYTPEELALYEVKAATTFTAVYSSEEMLYSVSAAPAMGTEIDCEVGTYRYGDTLTVSASALPGYVADGLKLYANGEEVSNPYELTVTEDVEFTTNELETKPSFIVSFYSWDEQSIGSVSVPEGGSAVGMVEAPEREGYTFAQWSLPIDNVTENMKVIAQYTKDGATNHTFNFYQDAKLLATLIRESGEEFTYPADVLGEPAKSGFDFMGWDKVFSPAAEDLDVFAVFQPNGYVESHTLTVKFGYDKPDVTYTQESGTVVTVEYPERSGYVFTGWTGDTAGLNGTAYTMGDADATITASWYDLTALNAAAGQIEDILTESDLYHPDYVSLLNGLLTEKGEKTAAVPASADDLNDLLSRMNTAIGNKDANLLYTLYVKVDGETVETIRDIAGASAVITTEPVKSGYSFKEWTVTAGSLVGSRTYVFAAANAEANAVWVISADSVAALRAEIEALSGDVYCAGYLAELLADLEAIEAYDLSDPANNDTVAEKMEELIDKLGEKDQHKHQFTVFVGYDSENKPTCTAAGTAIYACANGCEGKTTTKPVEALGHDWGEWVTVTEPTYGVDGEAKRTCARCGAEETKVLSLWDQSDKAIRFVTMNNMYYVLDVGEGVKIKTLTTYRWFSTQELRFKVYINSDFAYPDYVLYLNGQEFYPDSSGYYTVPAEPALSVVSIAGVVREPDPGNGGSSKVSFWQWLVDFFRGIASFFQRIFGR